MPTVNLDLFHAKHRLIDVAKKTHGAYGPFCRSLGDALAIADPRAMAELKDSVAALYPTFDPFDVDRYLAQNYKTTIQLHVPKLIPPPLIATERFDDVIKIFGPIRDATTGERGVAIIICATVDFLHSVNLFKICGVFHAGMCE